MSGPPGKGPGRWKASTWRTTSRSRVSQSPSTQEIPVSTRNEHGSPTLVTPSLLRGWPLPAPGEDKYSRGSVLVIGGARATPGAALLAGTAALRAGAGKLTLAVA